jgi:nitrogen fixation negative regulator NifL
MLKSSPSRANRTSAPVHDYLAAPLRGRWEKVVEAFALAAASDSALSPRLFYEIVQQSPLAISITDDQANILYVNPAFEALTGYAGADLLDRNESILSHRQTPVEVYSDLWSTIRAGRTWCGVLVNRRKDGKAYLAELHISPVMNARGEISYFLGIQRDVTEAHALEKQLHHQKALMESVLDSAPVIVALLDAERNVLLDNQAYKKLLGELHGKEPAALFLDVLQHDGFDLHSASAARRSFGELEVRIDSSGRSEPRWFSVSGTWVSELDSTATSYFDEQTTDRRCLLLLAHEVTALKQQMERVKMHDLRASLAEQQRVQGMREALSGAIFQLQTPIDVIQAAVGVLDRCADIDKARDLLAEVLQSGQQTMDTLRRALPAAMQEADSSVNMNTLLQDVLTLLTDDFLAQGVVIDWQPQTVLPNVNGRPNQLRSMLMRLAENALLAVGGNGNPQRFIRIATASHANCVEVLIEDNGPGIPDALRLKVFEPFYSAWKHAKGRAGMGLPLAQQTVKEHGGVIDVNADYRDGCQVRVTFPLRGSDSRLSGAAPPAGNDCQAHRPDGASGQTGGARTAPAAR